MEWLITTIKEIKNWFTTIEGIGTVSIGSLATFLISYLLKNRSYLKINAKYNSLSKEYEEYKKLTSDEKEFYQKQQAQNQLIIDDLYDLAIELKDNAKAQNEAMTIAFNNSNLNASAKKLVEEVLKPITSLPREDEMYKYPQNEISNAVGEAKPKEEVKEEPAKAKKSRK